MSEYHIINGDCLEILPTLKNKKIDLILTDPPYGLNFPYKSYNDTIPNLKKLIRKFLPLARQITSRIYIMSGITQIHYYPKPDWIFACAWNTTGSYGKYGYTQWMPVLAYGDDLKGFGKINGVLKSDFIFISGGGGVGFMRGKKEREHICPKPLNIVKHLVLRLSNKNDTILDPFLGSGTTLYASQDTGRNCIGIEIDADYCELVKSRCTHRRFLDRDVRYILGNYEFVSSIPSNNGQEE